MKAHSRAADIFRRNLRAIMDDRQLTITWLAERIGTSRQSLSAILAGRDGVTLTRVENIATALGVDLTTLLVDRKKSKQPA